ncbi:ribosomal protein S20 [Leptotrichia sp. oral taxon 215 str. W9775]|jgi:ribosomal protein S20|uniref:30S ribosomal protein S20 n=1 Tax=Leptotrichia sp. oral taxon 215 TaxID=712359 RepID=UPI0003AD8804|nr:30S ribosomal protein S20 [Leptotrichia sp. oral taxon 215]ERK66599.1 ribosomal protein S20 [Leptotrichia sp. oral taxon 215 str. W9775]MBF1192137.1 30S ribosomal protein S20 [Fusobacterium periodonticum]MBF1333183.1 30S ribosomal protein S20 [Leptotrichia sp.]MBF1336206.1 30S ribosomal protein S20 [Leptotrichia sp.]
MAHSKSSKKRVFIGERNAARNKSIKSRVKTFVKKVLIAVEAKNVDEAKAALQVAYKELDKAVTKGVLKKNTASRKKSRLTLKVNALAN